MAETFFSIVASTFDSIGVALLNYLKHFISQPFNFFFLSLATLHQTPFHLSLLSYLICHLLFYILNFIENKGK